MKYIYAFALLGIMVFWSSCRNDFESEPSNGRLEFSRDTVFLDTIFSNIGSSTYNLKIYNRSNQDINIPSIRLGRGDRSDYRLNVDGLAGKSFEDIQILAKDSIFIFVETTIDINNFQNPDNSFLYTDQILFDNGGNEQKVELVTLVQDAIFLFPQDLGNGIFETLTLGEGGDAVQIEGFFLDDNELNFNNKKPYVIYGYAAVGSGKTLTIDAGARVHFHANSGILIANNGSIKVNGTASTDETLMENEVIFEGDRLEPRFADVPGQWGTIWMTAGSTDNEFNFATIKNASVGLLMDSNDGDRTLTLRNVQIYNSANTGLSARTGDIYGENVVINNSSQYAFLGSLGGKYEFNHCTFANYWTNSFRNTPAVQLTNFLQISDTEVVVADLIQADFTNCIIYGNERRELGLAQETSAQLNYNFRNTLIRFQDETGQFLDNPLYNFNDTSKFNNIILNQDPLFQDTSRNNFNIEKDVSGAENIGLPNTQPLIDLNLQNRANPPDAGAYESIIF